MTSSRSRRVLRMIALFKLAKSIALVLIALATWELARGEALAHVVAWARGLPLVEGHVGLQHALGALASLAPSRIELAGVVALAYAALFAIEGWGLWHAWRWAEILTSVATASLIPFELWAFIAYPDLARALAITINLAVVAWLVAELQRKRAAAVESPDGGHV